MIRFLILLHVFLLARCGLCQLKQCYTPDGALATDLPCDPSANVSACCGQDWICSTNLYCSSSDGTKFVGSCTDKTWRDPACPFPWYVSGQTFDYTRNTTACDDGTLCPQANNATCCFNHQGIRQIVYHYSSSPLPTIAASLSGFYAANGYRVATVTSSPSSHTPSTNVLSISSTSTSPTAPTSAIVSQPNSSALPSTASDTPPTNSGLNSRTKAGVGVGVAVGVSLAGILLYILVRRRLRRQRQHQKLMHAAGTSSDSNAADEANTPKGSTTQQYQKPELTGEDARTELDAAEDYRRRRAELTGEQRSSSSRMEMEAAEAAGRRGNGRVHELLV